MKKIITLFLLLAATCGFAKGGPVETFPDVPYELRGVWYNVISSTIVGQVNDMEKRPLYKVTKRLISTEYDSLEILKVDKQLVNGEMVFAIHTEDPERAFLVVRDKNNIYMLYVLVGKNVSRRALIDIRQ